MSFSILGTDAYLPRGLCLAWEPGPIWSQFLSDTVIAASYFSIPVALGIFAFKRRDLPFKGVFVLFALFIIACGATHALGAVTLWNPLYRLDAAAKTLTALVSLPTAVALWWLLPTALRLPSNQQLEAANARLSHEIEQRRRAEHELRQLNDLLDERVRDKTAHLQSVLDTVPAGMIIIDPAGAIESFSAAAERIFGYRALEVIGRNVSMLMPAPYQKEHNGYLARYLTTGERRIIRSGRVVSGQRRDGEIFPMDLTIGEVVQGEQRRFIGFARDLTEQQRTERRMRDMQVEFAHSFRLNEMGQVASGLAHELTQPLASVTNYLSGIGRLLDRGDPASMELVRTAAASAIDQSRRAGVIIRRLREFVRNSEPERRHEDIVELLREAVELMSFTARERGVATQLEALHDPPLVLVDKVQIQQVLVNLLRNAIEAMDASPRREITVEAAAGSDGFVGVAVSDTGPGIDAEVAGRLFQPFTTTKAQGMGVGLSLCRDLVESHGGQLWAEPNPLGGAIFRFTVPIAPAMAEASQQ